MRNEFVGSIISVRAVEDTIRATQKYTKGAFTRPATHPIQGEDFPSRVLTEYYEVYPDLDIGQDRSFWDVLWAASDWLWGETPHIDVSFKYNYPRNKAIVVIHGGNGGVKLLGEGIPGFAETLASVHEDKVEDKSGTQHV